MSKLPSLRVAILLSAFLLPTWTSLSAQLSSASAASLGTGDNYTALARGFASVGLNPAGLGMPGTPGFSLALLPLSGAQTLSPISLGDISRFSGKILSTSTKNDWLEKITASGEQTGGADGDLTLLAFNAGPVGIQASTLLRARTALNEDAAELLLFGNAGRTGTAQDLELAGSRVHALAVSTVGIGFGIPVLLDTRFGGDETFALGATLKYSVGNALLLARDNGSALTSDPLEISLAFPMIQSDTSDLDPNHGSGVGLDLGVAWERGPWAVGAALLNVFHTFQWDLDGMFFRPGEAVFDGGDGESDFDQVYPAGQAPQALRDAVGEITFKPQLSVGLAYEAAADLTLTGDFRKRFGDGIQVGPELHAGLGLEYSGLEFLPIRLGAAKITDGFQLGGGLSLVMGPVNLSWAGGLRRGDVEGSMASFALSFGGY